MKAVKIEKFGSPDVLKVEDVEIGKPQSNEVLIKNLSIGINYIDTYHRTGLYPIPLPSGIGLEACGVIEEVGPEVKLFSYKLPSTHNTFIYLINGEIEIGKNKHDNVKDSTLILLTRGEDLTVHAKSNAKFLVISGKPINEEIARGGPFVMNTKAEILQAVQDYHNGTFVK